MLTLYLQLATVFFHIGLFGFGGGYAMISLIQFSVVNDYGWMNTSEFANLLALSQMTPGPISINAATYAGYQVPLSHGYGLASAITGSVTATLALVLPSLLAMWAVIKFLFKNEKNRYVQYLYSGLRPAVVGLIFSAGLLMMVDCDLIHNYVEGASSNLEITWKQENFGSNLKEHLISAAICIATFVAVFFYKKNPMYLIAGSGALGFAIYYL